MGDRIGVGLRPVPPPSTSCLLFHWLHHPSRSPTSSQDRLPNNAMAVAAHRGSILLRFVIPTKEGTHPRVKEEFFVYQACPGSSSPSPSLKELPACGHGLINRRGANNIGILRREDDGEFVVAHLKVTPRQDYSEADSFPPGECRVTADLCCIHGNESSWCATKDVPIRHAEGEGEDLVSWETDMVVPLGDRICWVDYLRGILVCDGAFSPSPELQYIPLPVDPYDGRGGADRGVMAAYRSLCVTGGGQAIKFIDVATCKDWFYGIPPHHASTCCSTIKSWR